ncbi:hypothetical protein QUN99_003432 [Vibrio parahaemolyticus]|nr:hypothetical protein [Vibrio parahaemolyticus]
MLFESTQPTTKQLIELVEIELELMVLNAKVRFSLDSYDVDDDRVVELKERYIQLGERYTAFCLDSNVNFHPLNSAIVQLHRATAFDFFWKEGVSNALEAYDVKNCDQCASHAICGIHG